MTDEVPRPGTAAPATVSPWNVANLLTVVRILLVPVFGALLLGDGGLDVANRWTAFAVFLVAMVTDRIDGDLARSRGLVTDVGKILDPIADKALLGMAFVGLSLLGTVSWWITVVVLAREIGITLLRLAVIRHGVMPAGRGGKLKTLLQTVALSLLILPTWTLPAPDAWHLVANLMLAAAVAVTVVTGLDYLLQAWRLREGSERTRARRAARSRAAGRPDRR